MKTRLTGITIPNDTNNTPTATFIVEGKMQTIPIPLPVIEDYLIERNYTYNVCQLSDCKIYYNFKSERDELIDKIIKGDDSVKWVVSEVYPPGGLRVMIYN